MKYLVKAILLIAMLAPVMVQAQESKVKNVDVSFNENDGYKKITIKKTLEDGTVEIVNWEGTGEIPEEIKKELGPNGKIIIHETDSDSEMIFIEGDSAKVMTKTVEIIVDDEEGAMLKDVKQEKEIKVIVKQEGENVIHLDKDAEVIILKEGEDVDLDDKDVKVWVQKAGDTEGKEIKVIVNSVDGEEGAKKVEKHIIIMKDDGKTEEIITTGDDEPTKELTAPVVEHTLKLKDFQVSPNPAEGQFNLSFKGKKAPITIRLFDAAGREMYKERITDFDGAYQNQIDVEGISSDLLFLSIEQKGKVFTEKIALKR